jgi:cytochrome b involved in lipid metabolism
MIKKVSMLVVSLALLAGCTSQPAVTNTPIDQQQVTDQATVQVTDQQNITDTAVPVVEVKTFTVAEVSVHNTPADCYTSVNGKVYDLTAWINKHPGGDKAILKLCGIDGTAAFEKQHGSNKKANDVLNGFEVGNLVQ